MQRNALGVILGGLLGITAVAARAQTPGSVDTSFDPGTGLTGLSDSIAAITLQDNGKILIGGHFTNYNGVARSGIARLNADGSLDATFDAGSGPQLFPGVLGGVNAIAVQPDGRLLVGGDFYTFSGVSCAGVIRLETNGVIDAGFVAAFTNSYPAGLGGVTEIRVRTNGQIWLAGGFVGGISGTNFFSGNLQRLNADGSRDPTFVGAGYGGLIAGLAEQPDQKLVIGGGFGSVNFGPYRIARVNFDGTQDPAFSTNNTPDNPVYEIARQSDGKIVGVGSFVTVNNVTNVGVCRWNSDGTPDTSFNVGDGTMWRPFPGVNVPGLVSDLALQADGKIIIGGQFLVYKGVTRNTVARLNTDASLDTTFDTGTGDPAGASVLALQPDGKLLVGGGFTSFNGFTRGHIVRLHATTGTGGNAGTLQFSSSTYSGSETGTVASITVNRTGGTTGSVTVQYATANGSATAGSDYTATNGTLTFADGVATQTFTVSILDDTTAEGNETVALSLSSPTGGAALGATKNAMLTILDNDAPPAAGSVAFTAASATVAESAGLVTVSLKRIGGTTGLISVDVTSSDGTTTAGQDYDVVVTNVTFATGQTSAAVTVPIRNDAAVEGAETFNLSLSNPTGGAVLGSPTTTVVTITDNDTTGAASFTDADGDVGSVALKGGGTVSVTQTNLEPPVMAPMLVSSPAWWIALTGTSEKSGLTINVKKGASGDGLVPIGGIAGTGSLKAVKAAAADLGGVGLQLSGYIGSVTVHDILDGAGIVAGGLSNQSTKITARRIGDNTQISLGSILQLTAATIGDCDISAPSAKAISIKGDKKTGIAGDCYAVFNFSGAGVVAGKPTLANLTVGNALSNAAVDVTGTIGVIQAARILDSTIYAGFTPADENDPLSGGTFLPGLAIKSVNAKAVSNAFVNSAIAADVVGSVKLTSVETNNNGATFGVIASNQISAVSIVSPLFKWSPTGGADQFSGDFHVVKP